MAGKNSVRIPVALELESEDIIKDYKATISKMSNIDDLQSQFKELLKLQKQYIDKANASADPMTKALNLQGVKAYSEMLSRIQSQVNKIDKTKLSDFALPKLQLDDKEILNSVNNIDKAVKGVLRDMENIGKSTGLGNLFKGIGSDSIKKFYQERIESSSDAVKYELKNNRLSIESIEKLLDTMQQYEIFNKKILKKSGTISTNVEDVLPKNLLKDENLFKNISLDELQVRWKKITTPDVVDNVRSAIIGNLSSRAMNKPLYIPTDGLIMNSEVANDFGAYQKKIDAAKLSLKEIGKEFVQLNENVDSAELSFKTKDGKDDIEQMNKYLDMAFKIKSAIQDVKSLSSAIGIGEKDALKLSDFGLARFDTVFDDIMGKSNTAVIYKYLDQVEESITSSFNKAMGDVGDDSEKVLRTKLSQINQIITDGTKLSYINESNLSEELDATLGKENALNLVLIQRQKIMSELVKKGYQLSEKELQANSATIQAEQIRKGYMPVFGPNGNVGSGSGDGNSNYSNDEVANLKKEYADITVEVEKYKQQITELTAKLQEYRTISNQPDNFKAKLLATEQALEAAQQKITELNQKISDLNDKLEFDSIVGSDGFVINQENYDNLVSALEKVKAEAQKSKDELEQLKATSVQLGEGEQVVKAGNSEAIKELGEAIKALQARMNKAEEILKDVPEGMNGLKQLSGQIGKMSGNFNEDGSLKNLGKTSEELSEQFKALETKFEERLNQKIAEIEKKSYKEKSPNRKFNLAGSLKDLKVVVKSQNDTLTSATQTSSSSSNFAGQSQQEIDAVNAIDKTVQTLTEHIQNKTTAIKAEATAMSEAAQSEVGSVEKISSAVTDLNNKITSIARIDISGNTNLTNPITVSATIGEAQIAAIREKIVAAFNENNPVPISFTPKIEGIREQITKAIGKAPIELKSSKTTNIFKIEKLTVSKKVVNELKNSIAEKLDSIQVKSFDVKSAAEKIKTDLGELLSDVKLRFDTSELESDIKEAMDNAAAQREVKELDEKPKDEPSPTQKAAYTRTKNDIEKITADAKKASEQIAQYLPENLKRELTNTVNVLSDMKPLANLDDAGAMSEWVAQSRVIADNWKTLNDKIQGDLKNSGRMADVFVNSMSNVKYTSEMNKDLDATENKFKEMFKDDQLEAFNAQLTKIREQLKAINSGEAAYNTGSVQSVIDDMSALNNMTDRFSAVNNAKTDINKMINKLNTAQNAVRGRGTQGQQFTNEITALMNQVKALEAERDRLATGTDEDINAFILKVEDAGKSVDDLKRRASDFKIDDNAAASADKLKAKFDDLIYKAQDFKSKNSKMNRDSGLVAQYNEIIRLAQTAERTTKNFNEINAKFNALKATVMSKGLTGRSLGDELGYIASKIGLKAMLGGSVYRVLGYFRQMVSVVKELDTGMTTLKRVTEETSKTYQDFLVSAGTQAHNLGSTISELVNSTGDFARLGYSLQEANELAKNAVMYSNVGWLDINTATADMTSTMKAFDIAAQDSIKIVDVFDILGKKLPSVTISVKRWRHLRPSKDIVFIIIPIIWQKELY